MAVGTENIETLLFRVFGVCAAKLNVIVALFVAGTVVTISEIVPVVGFQIAHKVVCLAELREQFELFSLRLAHTADEFVERLAPALLPVEASYLEHSPERGFFSYLLIDFARAFQSCPLSFPVRAVFPGIRALECRAFRIF